MKEKAYQSPEILPFSPQTGEGKIFLGQQYTSVNIFEMGCAWSL